MNSRITNWPTNHGLAGNPVSEARIVEIPAGRLQPNGLDRHPAASPQPATPVAHRPPPEANGALSRHGSGPRDDPPPSSLGHRPAGPGGAPPTGEQRRTLHLSLSPGNGSQANGGADGGELPPRHSPGTASAGPQAGLQDRTPSRPSGEPQAWGQPARPGPIGSHPPTAAPNLPQPGNSPPGSAFPIQPAHRPGEAPRGKNGGAFIDRVLRERVDGDIAAFLAAFDAALDSDTSETRTGLREATDRLLRAGARTRIELERLEARAPLPAHDKIGQTTQPLFRQR